MKSLEHRVVSAVADIVVDHLGRRAAGHCIQVGNLSREVADAACQLTHERIQEANGFARLVVDDESVHPWHATPTKIVELRNHVDETASKLAVFIPAGQHLAVEDSFGESTFEVVEIGDVYRIISAELAGELSAKNPDVAGRAEEILACIQLGQHARDSGEQTAAFLSRLVASPSSTELGWALTELDLLPDAAMGSLELPDFKSRLLRNEQQMKALTESAAPVERIRRLPLDPADDDSARVLDALRGVLADGTLDAHEIARRLGEPSLRQLVELSVWRMGSITARPDEFRVLQLIGDLAGEADPALTKTVASVGIKYRCIPAPDLSAWLGYLTLEVVRVGEGADEFFETGYEATKRTGLPKNPDAQWKLKLDAETLDEQDGLLCFRLRAWSHDNELVAEAVSPTFRVGDEATDEEATTSPATSIAAARVTARGEVTDVEADTLRTPSITLETQAKGGEGNKIASLIVRFGHASVASRIRVSRILAMLERETLSDPAQLGRYEIELGDAEISNVIADGGELPAAFMESRVALFESLYSRQLEVSHGQAPGPIVALADLTLAAPDIEAYVSAWSKAIVDAGDAATIEALLAIDQVVILDKGVDVGRLVGPTHPLRLLWLSRYSQVLEDWIWNADVDQREARELGRILATLHPANLPHVLVAGGRSLREIQPVDLYWSIYGAPSSADSTALAARVRAWLRMEDTAIATVSVPDVVQRIRRYLVAHPYVDLLILNFVEPGLGHLVLQTLLRLQDNSPTAHLRYDLRLFSSKLSRDELGSALDDFMADPEASRTAKKQAADAFLASNDNPLEPKLTYSKHTLDSLQSSPEKFPAHITLFLDSFDLRAVGAAPINDRRSFFGSGLLVDPVVVYRPSDEFLDPQWDEHVVADIDSDDLLVSTYATVDRATARLLGQDEGDLVPVVRLQLDRVRRAVLDAVHRSSDWVVIIDPVFTDEYLDTPPAEGEVARFLIDYSSPTTLDATRKVVVSTRSRAELQRLLRPVINEHGIDVPEDRVDVLLDGLQLLGSGLGLKLLNNRTQALEAFSMALGSLYLAEQGVLRRAIAIPLDLHQDLFREGQLHDPDEVTYLKRTDLAVVQIDPDKRQFGVHLVELKARRANADIQQLLGHVGEQLDNSRTVLRSRLFGADLRERPGSLAAALQVRRLSKLFSRYLERAGRYGLLRPQQLEAARLFIADLDGPYTVGFEKHALIFDLSGDSKAPEEIEGIRVVQIGRDEIRDILNRTRTPFDTRLVTQDDELKNVFETTGGVPLEIVPGVGRPGESLAIGSGGESAPKRAVHDDSVVNQSVEDSAGLGPDSRTVDIIGTAPKASHFGTIGSLLASGRPVAVDFAGANVISVFGVQGSGKSYTVGTLLEGALLREPRLNRNPRPLAGVVFHYSADLTYKPEFAAMGTANDDAEAIERLANTYSARPGRVEEVVILVPEPLVETRRAEFDGVQVEALLLGPDELNLNDWRLLMGLDGGEQMYARSMNNVFRKLRGEVSLESLRDEVEHSSMTKNQKMLATTRIEFVSNFVRDGGGVAHHVRSGRLVIVDIRDELIEQEEALAIFMVLLNRFGQVNEETERFNKIIVFDEAHKYMSNTRLTRAIVDNIRLIRHRGTTVVIASQDPPSVPKEVIELSTVIVAHRFTSPKWLDHVRKVNSAFDDAALQPSQMARLGPGEAFVWSVGGAEAFRRAQRVLIRPRITRHGGATRRAT